MRCIIFPHSSSRFTKGSLFSSDYLGFTCTATIFSSQERDYDSSSLSSSFLTSICFSGTYSTKFQIWASDLLASLSRLRMSPLTILKMSQRKEVVLQKSQNSWQNLSRKFQYELELPAFFSFFCITVFSLSTNIFRDYSRQKQERRGVSSSRMASTTTRMFSTFSMSCWFTRHSLAQICSILARLQRQNLRQTASNSEQPRMQPACCCWLCTVLSSFQTLLQRRLATYSRTKPAVKSKLISRRIWISSSVSFWKLSVLPLNLLISFMQQWSIFCVRSSGTSISSLLKNYSTNSQILRRGNLNISSQLSGGRRWQPVGLSLSFFRYISANRIRQYQQRWLVKKTPYKSYCMLRPRKPLKPHTRQKMEKRLWATFNSFRLYRKFFAKIWATFLQPVRTMNHSNRNYSNERRPKRWRMSSQSNSNLSIDRMLIRLPVIYRLKEKGVTTFSRNCPMALPLPEACPSEPLLCAMRKTCVPVSTNCGTFFFQSNT